jgi:DNA-binding NtrC family response regulator
MPGQILIADGDPGVLAGLAAVCRKSGWTTGEAHSAGEVLALARSDHPDVCLLDLDLALPGLELLRELVALREAPAVVFLTGLADVPTAVAAMRQGAADFLEKPVRRMVLEGVLERVLQNRVVRRERDRLREQVSLLGSGAVVGSSETLRQLLALVERVAATPRTTVLIQGETGAGKELVARAIHERSARSHGPFVAINCAALAEPLLEAELFGYEPGAFTGGAPGGHAGLMAGAEGGSLFLDEVGELAAASQAKLLRVLQERVYRRVGGSRDRRMDARIIAASNRDLAAAVEQGRFREDLYYRLNVMSLSVPPLRERREDIPELAVHFLRRFGEEFGKSFQGFTESAMRRLVEAPWPGNVRELKNTIERAALLASEPLVRPEHLVLQPGSEREGGPGAGGADPAEGSAGDLVLLPRGERSLRAAEEALIRRVLAETGGNRSRSARLLGINRTTLYHKLRTYGIEAGPA